MLQSTEHRRRGLLAGLALRILERVLIFVPVVILVWIAYVWLFANPDMLGWVYSHLQPVTVWFYNLVNGNLPETVRYKVNAGLSDELGPRALLLLILAALAEIVVLTVWYALLGIVRGVARLFRPRETV